MSDELKILMLEDEPADAELAEVALRKAGIVFSSKRVDTRGAFIAALKEFRPNIILADYKLPAFDGLSALAIAVEQAPDVPFVFVSGAMGEEFAIETLHQGAADYVIKDRLGKLVPAVNRALQEANERHLRRQAEAVRRELAAIVESSEEAIIGKTLDGHITTWNGGAAKMYGYSANEIVGKSVNVLVLEGREQEIADLLAAVANGKSVTHHETSRRCKDGRQIEVSLSLSPIRDASGAISGISTIARDITERKAAERALQRSNRFLRTLSRCNETVVHATEEIALLGDMCRVVVETGGFPMAWVGYVEHDPGSTIRPMAQFGARAAEYAATLNLTWADTDLGQGPTGRAVRSGQIQVAEDIGTDAGYSPWRPRALEFGYRSSVALPLKADQGVIATLNIYAAEVGVFGEEEIGLLAELAADLAFGIATVRTRAEQQESARRLGRALEDTIQAITTTIEARDPYTAGHQQRVSRLAAAIARGMGLDDARVAGVLRGAAIHDIGKIYVPSEILNRPGRLSDIEFSMIKTHPQVGYDIIKEIDFPWPIAAMILQHHERLDGSGYPNGLKGDAILLEARILAVADVVEAMMNHRPYRAALGLDTAIEEIGKCSGRLFDPAAVDACTRLLRNSGFPV